MTWYPIAFLPPQLENSSGVPYSGAVLKAYAQGTNTNIPMATDYTGVTTANSMVLNAAGYPTQGGAVVIPHLQQNYKLALYPTQAAANADSGPIWTVDYVQIAASTNSAFIQYFDGDGVTATFTLSQNFGTDENIIMVFADRVLASYAANTDFATDTIWSKGAGWTIGAGVATATGAISTAISQNGTSPLVQGQSYTVEFTVTASAGTLTPSVGGNAGTTRGAGTWRETIIAGSTQVIAFTGVAFTGTLDNASVKDLATARRMINRPDEYTLVGNQLTLNNIPPSGTKNVIVFAPSLLLGAANNAAAAAATSETNAAASALLASQWASQTSGIVAATDYSAKAFAIGGSNVTGSPGRGAAKEWAITLATTVDTVEYSAKEYAIGTTVPAGSSKYWSQQSAAFAASAAASPGAAVNFRYCGAAGGTANSLTLTPGTALTTNVGAHLVFIVNVANTGEAVNINVSGLGLQNIKQNARGVKTPLAIGQFQPGQLVLMQYDGTDYVVLNAAYDLKAADIASAATVAIGTSATTGNFANLTGTVTITAMSGLPIGDRFLFRHTGIHTLTHAATLFLLNNAQNITTAVGDFSEWVSDGTNVYMTRYHRANGKPLASTAPTITALTSGSGTYNTPAGCVAIRVRMVGSGSGGNGSGTTPGTGANGTASTFGTQTTNTPGSTGSNVGLSILGGLSMPGNGGVTNSYGGTGGGTTMGSPTPGPNPGPSAGFAGRANTGAGGSGASCGATVGSGAGGIGGTYTETWVLNPSATYSYAVAAAATGGTAGTSGSAGGNSGSGLIIVEEFYV